MNIRIISDLHIDVNNYKGKPYTKISDVFIHGIGLENPKPLTVIAGDISGSLDETRRFLRRHFKSVVFVGGNHIVYNHERKPIQQLHHEYREEFPKKSNITYLENDYKIIGDTVFIGATLWTDYEYGGNPTKNMKMAARHMNDFNFGYYKSDGVKEDLNPGHCRQMFFESIRAIKDIYDRFEDSGMKIVLVTHTGFAPGAVEEKFAKHPAISSYVNSPTLSEYISVRMPKLSLIIHGHTHARFEYNIGNIPAICNPFGYAMYGEDAEEPEFKRDFVVNLNTMKTSCR